MSKGVASATQEGDVETFNWLLHVKLSPGKEWTHQQKKKKPTKNRLLLVLAHSLGFYSTRGSKIQGHYIFQNHSA